MVLSYHWNKEAYMFSISLESVILEAASKFLFYFVIIPHGIILLGYLIYISVGIIHEIRKK